MFPISYKEAQDILGVSKSTVSQGVTRGVLTKIDAGVTTGTYLAREQVELFIGKRLSVAQLSVNEREQWQKIKQEIQGLQQESNEQDEDEPTSPEVQIEDGAGVFIAILLGLVVLFFVYVSGKKEVKQEVEDTIEEIGLDRTDLAINQTRAIEMLRSHPKETEKLKRILEQQELLTVA